MAYETVLYESGGGIATITLNRPDNLNSFNSTLIEELQKALAESAGDPDIRCVVITGAGRGFCAGADLAHLEDAYNAGQAPALGDMLRERYHPVILPIVNMEKPVVASVNGVAAGAGASLALACDFRIASDKAKFFQAFVKVGLVPDSGSTYFLPRLVGTAKAAELAMLGDIIGADEALRIGMVTKVVPADDLEKETKAFAERLAAGPTRSYALTKKALRFGAVQDLESSLEYEADLQNQIALTADHLEGVKAFMEKREPKFEGR
ncbi:MAG TPA: enoyl-CoA hydratase-related protein [Actinomycetota bacterium]|nr:enoyl-CoA hydratase-related protein [Actinomycetota bacterium]